MLKELTSEAGKTSSPFAIGKLKKRENIERGRKPETIIESGRFPAKTGRLESLGGAVLASGREDSLHEYKLSYVKH